MDELEQRPAVDKGMAVNAGEPEDPNTVSDAEKARRAALLYNQRATPIPAEWSAKK